MAYMTYLQKKFRFDICICGHTMKDTIYTLKKYPKESSDTRDATLINRFGGITNTIKGIRYLNKKIIMKSVSILGKDQDGDNAIQELKNLKVDYKSIARNSFTNDVLILISKLQSTKTVIVRFLSQKPKKKMNISDSFWVHFMYLDNMQFIDKFGNLVLDKKPGQFFSADISDKTINQFNLDKYLNKLDCLIFSTKELPTLFKDTKCKEFNKISMANILKLSKKINYIIVHNKKKSIYVDHGKIFSVKNNNKIDYKNPNILGAGDHFAASIINDMISKKVPPAKMLKKAHKFSSNYCLGKL